MVSVRSGQLSFQERNYTEPMPPSPRKAIREDMVKCRKLTWNLNKNEVRTKGMLIGGMKPIYIINALNFAILAHNELLSSCRIS